MNFLFCFIFLCVSPLWGSNSIQPAFNEVGRSAEEIVAHVNQSLDTISDEDFLKQAMGLPSLPHITTDDLLVSFVDGTITKNGRTWNVTRINDMDNLRELLKHPATIIQDIYEENTLYRAPFVIQHNSVFSCNLILLNNELIDDAGMAATQPIELTTPLGEEDLKLSIVTYYKQTISNEEYSRLIRESYDPEMDRLARFASKTDGEKIIKYTLKNLSILKRITKEEHKNILHENIDEQIKSIKNAYDHAPNHPETSSKN